MQILYHNQISDKNIFKQYNIIYVIFIAMWLTVILHEFGLIFFFFFFSLIL